MHICENTEFHVNASNPSSEIVQSRLNTGSSGSLDSNPEGPENLDPSDRLHNPVDPKSAIMPKLHENSPSGLVQDDFASLNGPVGKGAEDDVNDGPDHGEWVSTVPTSVSSSHSLTGSAIVSHQSFSDGLNHHYNYSKDKGNDIQDQPIIPAMIVSGPTPTSEVPDVTPALSPNHLDPSHVEAYQRLDFDLGSESESESDSDATPFALSDHSKSIFQAFDSDAPLSGTQTPSRERLEWHSMLATVLLGEVLNQEKHRINVEGGGERDHPRRAFSEQEWIELGARVEGRSTGLQARVIADRRKGAKSVVEDVIEFRVSEDYSDDGYGSSAADQIGNLLSKVEKMRASWPTGHDLARDIPRVESAEFISMEGALVAWVNVSAAVEFQVGVLRELVNEEVDVAKAVEEIEFQDDPLSESSETLALPAQAIPSGMSNASVAGSASIGRSFLERVLSDASLETLWSPPDRGLILRLDGFVIKAKDALVKYGRVFEERHFPSFIEDVQTLINFPSRLMKSLMEFRIRHARGELVDPSGEGLVSTEKTMREFHHLLKLAAEVKETYVNIVRPLDGWRLPDCIEEGYDLAFLDGLRFYFTMLNWRLAAKKNAEKETDILDDEWEGKAMLGKNFESGTVEIALQFCILTTKSLRRLTRFFIKEIQDPDLEMEDGGDDGRDVRGGGRRHEKLKHLKALVDGVRARQRKLLRFAKGLSERLENATEYVIGDNEESYEEPEIEGSDEEKDGKFEPQTRQLSGQSDEGKDIEGLFRTLAETGHLLVEFESDDQMEPDTIVIASPELQDQPRKICTTLNLVFQIDQLSDNPTYVLALRVPCLSTIPIATLWPGGRIPVACAKPQLHLSPYRLRLIANGMDDVLTEANAQLDEVICLRTSVRKRANITAVDAELGEIKSRFVTFSQTIVQSVGLIRQQISGVPGGDELVHRSFQFAADLGERSLAGIKGKTRQVASERLMMLAVEWLGFVCKDCDPSVGRTFRWTVSALEFAAKMIGKHVLNLSEDAYEMVQRQVAQCMSLLVSHFDIMGARSFEQRRRLASDERENPEQRVKDRLAKLAELDAKVRSGGLFGRVLDPNNEADRALALLSSVGGHVGIRWAQGSFLGGGTFGTVYAATDLDSGQMLAVKEIRLPDPLLIPFAIGQIRDEVRTLQRMRHPYIVQYFGIEPHRDKICIFMEYCPGGSLAALLEYGPIEDEVVVQLYTHMMLEGLNYLHSQGVAHRDLKPQNILLSQDGTIKFVDFGTAKSIARTAADLASKGEEGKVDWRLMSTIDSLDVEGLMALAPEVVYAAFSAKERERRAKEKERAAKAVGYDPVGMEQDEYGDGSEYDFGIAEDGEGIGGRTPSSSSLRGMTGLSGIGKDILTLLSATAPEVSGTAAYLPPEAVVKRFPKRTASTTVLGGANEGDSETTTNGYFGNFDKSDRQRATASSSTSPAGDPNNTGPKSPDVDDAASPPTAGDIWALGCVIGEMCTGQRPWIELDNEWAILYSISHGLTPVYPSPDSLSALGRQFMELCFEPDPRLRKTAAELLTHKWVREVADPDAEADAADEAEAGVEDKEPEESTHLNLPGDGHTENNDGRDAAGGARTPLRPASAPPSAVPSPSLRNAEVLGHRRSPEYEPIKRPATAPTSPRTTVVEPKVVTTPATPFAVSQVGLDLEIERVPAAEQVPVFAVENEFDQAGDTVHELLIGGVSEKNELGGIMEAVRALDIAGRLDGHEESEDPSSGLDTLKSSSSVSPGVEQPAVSELIEPASKPLTPFAAHGNVPAWKTRREKSGRAEKEKERPPLSAGMKRTHSTALRGQSYYGQSQSQTYGNSSHPSGQSSTASGSRTSVVPPVSRTDREKVERKKVGEREAGTRQDGASVPISKPRGGSGVFAPKLDRTDRIDRTAVGARQERDRDGKDKESKILRPRTGSAANTMGSGLYANKSRDRDKDRRRSIRSGIDLGTASTGAAGPPSTLNPGISLGGMNRTGVGLSNENAPISTHEPTGAPVPNLPIFAGPQPLSESTSSLLTSASASGPEALAMTMNGPVAQPVSLPVLEPEQYPHYYPVQYTAHPSAAQSVVSMGPLGLSAPTAGMASAALAMPQEVPSMFPSLLAAQQQQQMLQHQMVASSIPTSTIYQPAYQNPRHLPYSHAPVQTQQLHPLSQTFPVALGAQQQPLPSLSSAQAAMMSLPASVSMPVQVPVPSSIPMSLPVSGPVQLPQHYGEVVSPPSVVLGSGSATPASSFNAIAGDGGAAGMRTVPISMPATMPMPATLSMPVTASVGQISVPLQMQMQMQAPLTLSSRAPTQYSLGDGLIGAGIGAATNGLSGLDGGGGVNSLVGGEYQYGYPVSVSAPTAINPGPLSSSATSEEEAFGLVRSTGLGNIAVAAAVPGPEAALQTQMQPLPLTHPMIPVSSAPTVENSWSSQSGQLQPQLPLQAYAKTMFAAGGGGGVVSVPGLATVPNFVSSAAAARGMVIGGPTALTNLAGPVTSLGATTAAATLPWSSSSSSVRSTPSAVPLGEGARRRESGV